MAQETVQHRQLMVEPPAGEADCDHEGRRDMAQRLVEIGRLLLGDRKQPVGEPDARGVREGIHVADHRHRRDPGGKAGVGSAIRRDDDRRNRPRRGQIIVAGRRPADQRHWFRHVYNHAACPDIGAADAACRKSALK